MADNAAALAAELTSIIACSYPASLSVSLPSLQIPPSSPCSTQSRYFGATIPRHMTPSMYMCICINSSHQC
ncbi:predicted protein [Plenodomus lingam JN3]|uniref:Predicted protein n=1 Tax=Leptosphaeria maculans (strain JN3 / isolate v23.1.3 / race Av1-4-5-6-7-8) TaxID=985895 RepID=E4ZU27_LEPMJ|nr:predicted protein [Plenodomus lingam JN3]CBX94737.1 predicted protein [Plenodomus lingam JN3]